jgi:mycothione reductase
MSGHYDVIVLGSGGGAKIARPAARMGLRVALLEKEAVGGTCLNRGCIPSKMLIYPAEVRDLQKRAERYNLLDSRTGRIDFKSLIDRISTTVDGSSDHQRDAFDADAQIDFFPYAGRFVSNHEISVNGEIITGDKIFIATGTEPSLPPIDGLADTPFMTSREALRNTTLPQRLIVIGAGFIAVELGYAYGAFGTQVDFVVRSRFLRGQDDDVVAEFEREFSKHHTVHKGHTPQRVEYADGLFSVHCQNAEGEAMVLQSDALLVASGVRPMTDDLGLEHTDVECNEAGYIRVDSHLRTHAPNVFALGDCVGNYFFRHSVNYEGEYLVRRFLRKTIETPIAYGYVPSAVFTHPQIASVGKTEEQLRADGVDVVVGTATYADSTPGMARLSDHGLVKVLADRKTHRLLGAHIVGDEASDMIHLFIAMMKKDGTIDDLLDMIFIHPSLPEVARDAVRDAGTALGIYDG